jgi:hypothetical protein
MSNRATTPYLTEDDARADGEGLARGEGTIVILTD